MMYMDPDGLLAFTGVLAGAALLAGKAKVAAGVAAVGGFVTKYGGILTATGVKAGAVGGAAVLSERAREDAECIPETLVPPRVQMDPPFEDPGPNCEILCSKLERDYKIPRIPCLAVCVPGMLLVDLVRQFTNLFGVTIVTTVTNSR